MLTISFIILANTVDDETYNTTLNCVESIYAQKNDKFYDIKIQLIESNKHFYESSFSYPKYVNIFIPPEKFGYHRFMNIGIRRQRADIYALCNNDLIFHEQSMPIMVDYIEKHPEIGSFSPRCPITDTQKEFTVEESYVGYKTKKQLSGWCLFARHDTIETIGYLDETFDFYFADDDYGLTLRKHNIINALVTNALVSHVEKQKTSDKIKLPYTNVASEKNLPRYLKSKRFNWITQNEKMLEGHLKFIDKWGNWDMLYIKKKIHDITFLKLRAPFLTKLIFK